MKIFFSLISCLFALNIYAQPKLVYEVSNLLPGQRNLYNPAHVQKGADGTLWVANVGLSQYADKLSKVNIELSFPSSSDEPSSESVSIDEIKNDSIKVKQISVNEDHKHVACKIVFIDKTNEKLDSTTVELDIYAYEQWKVDANEKEREMVSGYTPAQPVSFKVNAEGGRSGGWVYEWYDANGTKIPGTGTDEFVITNANPTDYTLYKYSVVASNLTAEGDTIFKSDAQQYELAVYAPISLQATADKKAVIRGYNDMVTLTASVTGGPTTNDAWELQWYVGDTNTSHSGSVFTYTPAQYTGSSNLSVHLHAHIAVKAKNGTVIFEGNTPDCEIMVFPEVTMPSLSAKSTKTNLERTTVVDGYDNELVFSAKASGGYANGWTYTLYEDNKALTSLTQKLTADGTHTYKMRVVNTYENETLYDSVTEVLSIAVRPKASVFFEGDREEYILTGESISLQVKHSGGVDDDSRWVITKFAENGTDISVPTGKTFTKVLNNDNIDSTQCRYWYQVSMRNVLSNGEVVFEGTSEVKNITVCYEPKAYKTEDIELKACPTPTKKEFLLKGKTTGGSDSSWKFIWQRKEGNGKYETLPNLSELEANVPIENETRQTRLVTYKLVWENQIGVHHFTDSLVFPITLWPAITNNCVVSSPSYSGDYTPQMTIPVYVGDNLTFTVTYSGGNPDGWNVTWRDALNNSLSNNDSWVFDTSKDELYTASVQLRNSLEEEVWLNETTRIYYETFNKGEIDQTLYQDADSTDVYNNRENLKVNLEVKVTKDGYKGTNPLTKDTHAWTFEWMKDGAVESTTYDDVRENQLSVPSYKQYGEATYKVVATNRINDNIGYTGNTHSKTLRFWPKATFGKISNSVKRNLRNSDEFFKETVDLLCDASTGAYTGTENGGGWYYQFNSANNQNGRFSPFIDEIFEGTEKSIKSITYRIRLLNKGPYGKVWTDTVVSHTVNVYRTPAVPSLIRKKGNGSSGMLIVTFDNLDNSVLEENGYEFVYGYIENGKEHHLATTPLRYLSVGSLDANRTYYVYSQWHYEDGAVVTSNKRMSHANLVSKGDVVYSDKSDFSKVTRSIPSAIDRQKANDNWSIKGNHIKAQFQVPTAGVVSMMSVNGKVLRQYKYAPTTHINESINLNGLKPGLYLLRYAFGSQEEVVKLNVK